MKSPDEAETAKYAGILHTRISLGMLLIVFAILFGLELLANSPKVTSWMRRQYWSLAKETRTVFSLTDHYIDFEDRLIHDEIAHADYSRGGVYFLGSSVLKWAFATWDLPAEEQRLIHNYGIGHTTSKIHLDLIRLLVEQEGLLRAGSDKTLIVFGLNYFSVGYTGEFYYSIWNRHSLFKVDRDGTIRRTGLNRFVQAVLLERTKIPGIAKEFFEIARLWAYKLRIKMGVSRTRLEGLQTYTQRGRELLSESWKEKVAAETANLSETMDYLQERKVPFAVILMPHGSWEKRLPWKQVFNDSVSALCHSRGVRLYDFSSLVSDDDFADPLHLAPTGVEKFRDAIMPICLEHLGRTGAFSGVPGDAREHHEGVDAIFRRHRQTEPIERLRTTAWDSDDTDM